MLTVRIKKRELSQSPRRVSIHADHREANVENLSQYLNLKYYIGKIVVKIVINV